MPEYREYDSWANLLDVFAEPLPEPPVEPVSPPPPPDEVLVHRNTYCEVGMYGGRSEPRNMDYIRVLRRMAERYGVPDDQMFGLNDELPEYRRCGVCGRTISPNVPDEFCSGCIHRAAETRRALENGGRRFGIELEFSLPEGYYSDYDDDDYCDDDLCQPGECDDCDRRRRIEREERQIPGYDLDPATIAARLTDAGLPTIAPGYTHNIFPGQWKIVPDGSLSDGYELVSPPLQWRDAEQVRIACATLEAMGCQPTEQCGLHVHHDVGDLTVSRARTLARNWRTCQPHTEQLVAPSRVFSDWCYPVDDSLQHRQCEFDGEGLHRFFEIDYERYRALNWTCWNSYGTVEVRMHESTFDPDEILAWVAYGQSIIDASMSGRELEPPDDLDHTLNQLTIRRAAGPNRIRQLLKAKAARNAGSQPTYRRRGGW